MLLTLRSQFQGGSQTPREIADATISALSPAAWYRNATNVTSAGGFASAWGDYSGNGRDLLQATGTNQPAYSNGVMTGDGLDNFMKIVADAAIVQPITIYWVGKQVTWTNADYFFDGNSSNSGGLYQNSSTPSFNLYAGAALGVNTNLAVNTRGVVCAVINNTSSSTRVNDTAKVSGTAGTANMGGFCLFSIGGGNNGWSNTAVEEVAIFLAAHDDATQSSVITALNNALTVF